MKHKSPFVISEFTNPSGNIVFQLYARLDGKRFRKNFPTRAEAEAERQVQEVQWLQFPLAHDVMRHTFISMFVAKFRSIGEASLQAGNSESIIRKHYLDLKTEEEGEEFFGILPKKADVPAAPAAATLANAA